MISVSRDRPSHISSNILARYKAQQLSRDKQRKTQKIANKTDLKDDSLSLSKLGILAQAYTEVDKAGAHDTHSGRHFLPDNVQHFIGEQ